MATKKKEIKKAVTRSTRRLPEPETKPQVGTSIYKVEAGVPITSQRVSYQGDRFPLGQMNIGDSFVIPASDPINKNPNTLHYAAKMYARIKPGFTLTTRLQLDKARRVWRIK
jgi:hypothetical protein